MTCACGCGRDEHIRHLPFSAVDHGETAITLARALNIDRRFIYRWRAHGVTVNRAEWLADRLGKHPTELWDNYYEVCS